MSPSDPPRPRLSVSMMDLRARAKESSYAAAARKLLASDDATKPAATRAIAEDGATGAISSANAASASSP
eukprot:30931-Pelagococcus_subviridis.AAC.1